MKNKLWRAHSDRTAHNLCWLEPRALRTMPPPKKRKPQFSKKFGYGALAVYAIGMVLLGGSVYGLSLTNLLMKFNAAERAREAARTGRMVFATPDRMACRSYRFDNQTAELGTETTADCDEQKTPNARPSGSFGAVHDGFNNR
jgi:hypothetical protein